MLEFSGFQPPNTHVAQWRNLQNMCTMGDEAQGCCQSERKQTTTLNTPAIAARTSQPGKPCTLVKEGGEAHACDVASQE
jgi:hypothetical protein